MKFLLILAIFTIQLNEYDTDTIDNSVVIVLDELYCKSCLDSIISCQELWKEKYSTVLLVRSKKLGAKVKYYATFYGLKIKYDEIYFYDEKTKKLFNKPITKKTPFLVIIKNGKKAVIDYHTLFNKKVNKPDISNVLETYL